jgi:uncharacterized cofD-like protein
MIKQSPGKGPRIVAIGGGTGLSTLLRGLKVYSENITAVVTVTDDGGSSGTLRRELGVPPPGDIRSCLVALSQEETLLSRLFQYRFSSSGSLAGHSFGNLFLTAMTDIAGGFDKAVASASSVLAVRGRVLPVTLRSVTLTATLENGKTVKGESAISRSNSRIDRLHIKPTLPPACPEVIKAIALADCIVLGPGSLYTSIISNLLVDGVGKALKSSKAPKIYVANIMTQPGETSGYTLNDHLKAIECHGGEGLFNLVLSNRGKIPQGIVKKYAKDGAWPVTADDETRKITKVICSDVFSGESYARHDSDKLARAIMRVVNGRVNIC